METGAYLVNGTEVVADTAEAAALIKNKTGLDIVKEEALKNTIVQDLLMQTLEFYSLTVM